MAISINTFLSKLLNTTKFLSVILCSEMLQIMFNFYKGSRFFIMFELTDSYLWHFKGILFIRSYLEPYTACLVSSLLLLECFVFQAVLSSSLCGSIRCGHSVKFAQMIDVFSRTIYSSCIYGAGNVWCHLSLLFIAPCYRSLSPYRG